MNSKNATKQYPYQLFLLYGCYHVLIYTLTIVSLSVRNLGIFAFVGMCLLLVLLLLGYYSIYKDLKQSVNQGVCFIFKSWIMITGGILLMARLIPLLQMIFFKNSVIDPYEMSKYFGILIFIISILICEYMTGEKWLGILAIIILVSSLLINVFLAGKGIPILQFKNSSPTISYETVLIIFGNTIGYLLLGAYLKRHCTIKNGD